MPTPRRILDLKRAALPLVAALVLMGFVQPPPTAAEPSQSLAGTSALTVQGAGSAVINVPQDIVVSLVGADNPNLSLSTDAEAAAAVLVGPDDTTLLWGRTDPGILCTESSSASCHQLLSELHVLASDLEPPDGGAHARIVPAGRYTLHVVATSSSAVTTATIVADDLSGETTLDATSTPTHELSVLHDMGATNGAGLTSAGSSGEIAEDGGTLFHFVAATGSLTASAEIGDCVYDGEPPAPPVAYAPPCLGGETTSVRFLGAGNTFTYTLQGMVVDVAPGRWSQGGYVAGPMLADDGVVVNLWLG